MAVRTSQSGEPGQPLPGKAVVKTAQRRLKHSRRRRYTAGIPPAPADFVRLTVFLPMRRRRKVPIAGAVELREQAGKAGAKCRRCKAR
jgi:hypothetical protein